MNNNYQNGGYQNSYPQSDATKGGSRQPKMNTNKLEFVGVVRPIGADENAPIKFIPFRTGGGVIHFQIRIVEPSLNANGEPRYDQGQNPIMNVSNFRVNVRSNRNISPDMLQRVVSGMKVHVVGRLVNETFTNKQTGKVNNIPACDAYVFEILETPMQQYAPQYGGQVGYQQPVYGQPQAPVYPQQGGYPPQQGSYNPAQVQGQQMQYPPRQQGGYQQPQQPQQPQTPPAYYQQAPQSQPAPAYYQPAPKAPAAPTYVDDGDLPPADAPAVKDINI